MKPRLLLLVLLAVGLPAVRRDPGLFVDRRERHQAFLRFAAAAERERAEDQGPRQPDLGGRDAAPPRRRSSPTRPSPRGLPPATSDAISRTLADSAENRDKQCQTARKNLDILKGNYPVADRPAPMARRRCSTKPDASRRPIARRNRSSSTASSAARAMRAVRCFRYVRGRSSLCTPVMSPSPPRPVAWWYFAPQSMPGWLARKVPSSPSLGPPLYKWRDAQGRLHVTDSRRRIGRMRRFATIRIRMSCRALRRRMKARSSFLVFRFPAFVARTDSRPCEPQKRCHWNGEPACPHPNPLPQAGEGIGCACVLGFDVGPCGAAKGGRTRPAQRAGRREGSRRFCRRPWMACRQNPGRP